MLHLDLHINNSLAQAAIIKALPCSDLFIQQYHILTTIIHFQRYTLTILAKIKVPVKQYCYLLLLFPVQSSIFV